MGELYENRVGHCEEVDLIKQSLVRDGINIPTETLQKSIFMPITESMTKDYKEGGQELIKGQLLVNPYPKVKSKGKKKKKK